MSSEQQQPFQIQGVGFFVLSKSGCPACDKVKDLLSRNGNGYGNVVVENCDAFLTGEAREPFLARAKEITKLTTVRFPMVFHNGLFVGGYADTVKYIENGVDDF